MTDYPTFKNSPITEALLDVQVSLPFDIDLAKLASVQDQVRERYPAVQERHQWQIQAVAMGDSQPEVSQSGGVVGYIFFPDPSCQDRAFQSRLNGFTFSKLKPYETWDAFQAEARELWDIYSRIAQPTQINRLALRTVNRLNLPMPFSDFKEYILTTPEVAPGIPSNLAQFFMQLSIPQPGGEIAVVTSAMSPLQLDQTFVTIIFDIDVFVEETLLLDAEMIWEKCESLRQVRNGIFFNSLTDKAKELF